jgi:hypothetical protein
MMTLTKKQILEAIEICEDDETELTFVSKEAFIDDDGGANPAGIYCYLTEYREEGFYGPLGIDMPAPPQACA